MVLFICRNFVATKHETHLQDLHKILSEMENCTSITTLMSVYICVHVILTIQGVTMVKRDL